MRTFDENEIVRQPAGRPDGGRFVEQRRPASGLALAEVRGDAPSADAELELFELDGVEVLGYDSGEEWNGFAVPWLTDQSMQRIATASVQRRGQDPEAALVYRDEATQAWVVDEADGAGLRTVERSPGRGWRPVHRLDGWTFTAVEPWDEDQVEEFVAGELAPYLATALWSSTDVDDDGEMTPLSELDGLEWSEDAKDSLRAELTDFVTANQHLIRAARAIDPGYEEPGQVGHDFWLTRNGHGAGFWDRGLGDVGGELSTAAKSHGGVDLYVGDDGKAHVQ